MQWPNSEMSATAKMKDTKKSSIECSIPSLLQWGNCMERRTQRRRNGLMDSLRKSSGSLGKMILREGIGVSSMDLLMRFGLRIWTQCSMITWHFVSPMERGSNSNGRCVCSLKCKTCLWLVQQLWADVAWCIWLQVIWVGSLICSLGWTDTWDNQISKALSQRMQYSTWKTSFTSSWIWGWRKSNWSKKKKL